MTKRAHLDPESMKAELERAADAAGAEMSKAIQRMGDAIRAGGAGCPRAVAFEAEADAAFDRGEEIASKLLALEAEIAAAPAGAPDVAACAA
jgi:hypothetical protein